MKKYLLNLAIIVGMCMLTCADEPYPDFYEGTPEDDDKINDILENDYPELLVTGDQFTYEYSPMTIAAVVFTDADQYFRTDSPLIKVNVDSIADSLITMDRFKDLWYAKDTTCTVRLFDTFDVKGLMHVAVGYTAHFDQPETTATGDTVWRIGTIDTSAAFYDYEDYAGEGLRFIFLEPERDDAGAIIEPFEWILKRISYGIYYFPDRGATVPTISRVILEVAGSGQPDTIFSSNNDSLFTGHAMNRFKHIDSLLEYTAGESLNVIVNLTGDPGAAVSAFFASAGDGWTQVPAGAGSITIPATASGITNLYFKVITRDTYYYYYPNRGYFAVAWLIPVKIN